MQKKTITEALPPVIEKSNTSLVEKIKQRKALHEKNSKKACEEIKKVLTVDQEEHNL